MNPKESPLVVDGQYEAEWQAWHDSRISELATPFGWLSVTGLHWLPEDKTVSWDSAPGTFTRRGDTVTFALRPGITAGPAAEALGIMGEPREGMFATIEADGEMTATVGLQQSFKWIVVDSHLYEVLNRDGHVGIRVRDRSAPLLKRFVDIPTFELTADGVVTGTVEVFEDPVYRRVATATPGLENTEAVSGRLVFDYAGRTHTLYTSGCPHTGLHINFHDRTNGVSTAMWRRLDLGVPDKNNHVIVDFNRAVNWPFAFTPYATCTAPVPENLVDAEIVAGERQPTQTLGETGPNTPLLVLSTIDNPLITEVIRFWEALGLEITRVRLESGETMPPLAGFAGVFCITSIPYVLDEETRRNLLDYIGDAIATDLPVLVVGSGAAILAEADDTLSTELSEYVAEVARDYPDASQMRAIPVAVSANIAEDAFFAKNIAATSVGGIGFIKVDDMAAQFGELQDVDPKKALHSSWRTLLERFARFVHTHLDDH